MIVYLPEPPHPLIKEIKKLRSSYGLLFLELGAKLTDFKNIDLLKKCLSDIFPELKENPLYAEVLTMKDLLSIVRERCYITDITDLKTLVDIMRIENADVDYSELFNMYESEIQNTCQRLRSSMETPSKHLVIKPHAKDGCKDILALIRESFPDKFVSVEIEQLTEEKNNKQFKQSAKEKPSTKKDSSTLDDKEKKKRKNIAFGGSFLIIGSGFAVMLVINKLKPAGSEVI